MSSNVTLAKIGVLHNESAYWTANKYPVASANAERDVLRFVKAGPTEKSARYLDMGDSSRARLVVSGKDAKELRRLPTARM